MSACPEYGSTILERVRADYDARTEALYTTTGGPKEFYDELGFPWCIFMLDTKTYYAEAPLGFERSESTSYLPHPRV